MSEPDERQPPARSRWFQFDLRLLFLVVAAIGVILAIEVARNKQSQRKFLETLRVGESVDIYETDSGLTIYVNRPQFTGRPVTSSGTVTEIGEDFVAIRRDSESCDVLYPATRIRGVQRFAPGAVPMVKSPPKNPGVGPGGLMKTVKTDSLMKTGGLMKTNDSAYPRKTMEPLNKTDADSVGNEQSP